MKELKAYIDQLVKLPEEDWEAFKILFTETTLSKNVFFAEQGRKENLVGFLTEGVVRAFYRNEEGIEYNKTFFEPYEFVGAYVSLVRGDINHINLQALTEVKLWTAGYPDIVKLFDKHPGIERLCRLLAENLYAYKEKREIELVLLDAARRYELFKKEYPTLENRIPQYHIASYLGVTPTQLSRIRGAKK